MNSRVVITVATVTFAVLTGVSLAFFLSDNGGPAPIAAQENVMVTESSLPEPQSVPESSSSSSSSSTLPQPQSPGYLLREHEGKLGVFVGESSEPEMLFDVYIRYLPEYDRQQLAEGIYIEDYAKLVSLIEDYIS